MTKRTVRTVLGLGCAVALLGGCAMAHYETEAGFGDTVRAAQAQQTINPDASRNLAPPNGLEGAAAKAVVDRYEKSFETPPAPVNVFNIGVGNNSGGSSSR